VKQDRGLSVRDGLNAIYRRIHVLKFVVIALPLAVLLACFIVQPVYEVTGNILVTAKRENSALLQTPGDQRTTNILNMNVDETDLNSEMALLTSPELWISTVKKLGLPYFRTGKPGIVQEWWTQVKQTLSELVSFDGSKSGSEAAGDSARVQELAKGLARNLKVTPAPKSKIINLSFVYSDPEKAQKILATLLELYIPYHFEAYRLPGAEGFFAGQGDLYKKKYETAEKELADFKRTWAISYAERQKSELIVFIKQIEDALVEVRSNIGQYEDMLATLKNDVIPTGQLAPGLQRGGENTVISVIATQLLRAKQKQIQLAELFSPDSRDYLSGAEMVKDLTQKFQGALQSEMRVLQAKRVSLEGSLKEKQKELQQLEEKSEEARRLQLETSIAKERYLQFVSKEEEARLANLEGGNRLVSVSVVGGPLVPSSPTFPKTRLFVVISLILAFPIGIGAILVANFFDHTFDNPKEVESGTGYPVLAALGRLPKTQFSQS
jgi:uncharacterized protein involved in exopolysaccharide biosynthesis